jgi:hypothetical protein
MVGMTHTSYIRMQVFQRMLMLYHQLLNSHPAKRVNLGMAGAHAHALSNLLIGEEEPVRHIDNLNWDEHERTSLYTITWILTPCSALRFKMRSNLHSGWDAGGRRRYNSGLSHQSLIIGEYMLLLQWMVGRTIMKIASLAFSNNSESAHM